VASANQETLQDNHSLAFRNQVLHSHQLDLEDNLDILEELDLEGIREAPDPDNPEDTLEPQGPEDSPPEAHWVDIQRVDTPALGRLEGIQAVRALEGIRVVPALEGIRAVLELQGILEVLQRVDTRQGDIPLAAAPELGRPGLEGNQQVDNPLAH
jgi:hypothetical protein